MQNHDFEVIRNHDYTITVKDRNGRHVRFRDITGEDLEYLDSVLNSNDQGEKEGKYYVPLKGIQSILDYLGQDGFRSGTLTQKTIIRLFNCVKEHILCNYMPKYSWLKICYGIQNGSFANLLSMERVPMTKFMAMDQIHKEAMESVQNTND
jgi:hypothetical protein